MYALLMEHADEHLGDEKFFDDAELLKMEATFGQHNHGAVVLSLYKSVLKSAAAI